MNPKLPSAILVACLAHLALADDPKPAGDPFPTDAPATSAPGTAGLCDPYFPGLGNGGYDALHYDLDFELEQDLANVVATTRIRSRATSGLSTFNLDLHGLDVRSIEVDGAAAEFVREGDELTVKPAKPLAAGSEFTTLVKYDGKPEPIKSAAIGMEGIGWMHTKRGVFVVSEPEGAASFFPVNDHPSDKATYSIRVVVPSPWVVASNGTPAPEEKVGEKTAFLFTNRDPMASYLVTIAIAEFDVEDATTAGGLPLRYYFPKKMGERGKVSMRKTGPMIEWFETIFGPYPYECGGGIVAAIPIPGALETQTRPIYGITATDESIVAHEIAHQWFGDNVTMKDWSDIWLAEGFAEYAAWLWTEHEEGTEALDERVEKEHRRVRDRKVKPSGDPGKTRLFGSESYNRGPLVLHALRRTIGDETFFAVLRAWNAKYRNGNATIPDFIALVNEVSGRDHTVLLKAWLYDRVAPPLDEF